jgi:hypothetical protein
MNKIDSTLTTVGSLIMLHVVDIGREKNFVKKNFERFFRFLLSTSIFIYTQAQQNEGQKAHQQKKKYPYGGGY